jgi:hypothetical protein
LDVERAIELGRIVGHSASDFNFSKYLSDEHRKKAVGVPGRSSSRSLHDLLAEPAFADASSDSSTTKASVIAAHVGGGRGDSKGSVTPGRKRSLTASRRQSMPAVKEERLEEPGSERKRGRKSTLSVQTRPSKLDVIIESDNKVEHEFERGSAHHASPVPTVRKAARLGVAPPTQSIVEYATESVPKESASEVPNLNKLKPLLSKPIANASEKGDEPDGDDETDSLLDGPFYFEDEEDDDEIIFMDSAGLPEGWTKVVLLRTSGEQAGHIGVYYRTPEKWRLW